MPAVPKVLTIGFAAACLVFATAAPADARDDLVGTPVTLDVPGAVMAGTAIDTPSGAVVLFISGSGPTDRNGNSRYTSNDSMRLLAEGLARRGFASVRFDKRFSGETIVAKRDETQVTLDRYAEDAAAWFAEAQSRYPDRPVLPLGHSEGGIVALRLSQIATVDGLILVAVPARSLDVIVAQQLEAAGASGQTTAVFKDRVAELRGGEPVGEVPDTLKALLRPGVYPYWRSVLRFDAAGALAGFAGPALLVYGERDLQVSPVDFEIFITARPGVARHLFPAMNHVLRTAPADRAGNLALYQMPGTPLQADLVSTVADFLTQQAAPGAR